MKSPRKTPKSAKGLLQGVLFLTLFLLFLGTAFPPAQETEQELKWYKGNTHTHTLNSDGDSTPDDVVRWYREHGYHFLVLTDHNYLTNVEGLNAVHGAKDKFIVIPGEEVSDRFQGSPIHLNGLNLTERVAPQGGGSLAETVQRNVDAIRKVQGIPHINHPNFQWALTAADLKEVHNYKLFEIYNGHHRVNNLGGGDRPGLEEMWDELLSSGKVVYGIAVDDAHVFKNPWNREAALPGRGWVMVRARRLTPDALFTAMERGEFYATTGVELENYQVNAESITVAVRELRATKYRIQFIGKDGQILKEATETPAVYRFRGDELYARAKVIDSNGNTAWTQPAFPRASMP